MKNRKNSKGENAVQLSWQNPKSGESCPGIHWPLRRLLNLAILAALHPTPLWANPDGAQIINGQVSIDTATPGVTTITNSPNAIIQWQNFNIAQNETTRFVQQNSQSAVLNRIIGENPSAILGQLASNGKVFLINPNGVIFGANSVVDTQGLIASSLNLSDQDFLTGNYHFVAGSNTKTGAIVNEGIIRAGKNGNVILIAPSIQNNGIIKSDGGQITLAAGQELVLTSLDNPDIRYAIQAPDNAVLNLGKLLTEGGAVNVFAGTITHSGEINADSVTVDAQGHIQLVAQNDINLTQESKLSANNSQGNAGTIQIDSKTGTTTLHGALEAKAAQTGKGGDIALLGEQVGVLGKARINASGDQGGGQILIGGDQQGKTPAIHNAKATYIGAGSQINADAKIAGNGGKVIAWSEQATRAYGQISAQGGKHGGDGGFVETSGQWLDTSDIRVDASAAQGKNGEWLLDPNDITIQATGTDTHVDGDADWTTNNDSAILTTGSIQSALNKGTSVTVTTGAAGNNTQTGNITVASAITKTAGGDAKLSLNAHDSITIDAPITATAGKLNLTLTPGTGGSTAINKTISLNAGTLTLPGNSTVSGAIKNAAVTLPKAANSQLNGLLDTTKTVTIEPDATLTINRGNANFNGLFNNRGTLAINAYWVMKALKLDGGILTGSGAVIVNDEFEFESGHLTGTGQFTTTAGSTTTLASSGTAYLDKNWNNFGTINWQGVGGLVSNGESGTIFNNMDGGAINISAATTPRQLDMATFNNRGTVNLSGGELKVLSHGHDTGDYTASNNGHLQFYGPRYFREGAALNSDNTVTFANSNHYFWKGSSYKAAQTEVTNGGTLNLYTGSNIKLPVLTLDTGTLGGSDTVTVSEQFNFHSGTLAGGGVFSTAAGSTTALADSGTAFLDKRWDNSGTIAWQGLAKLSNHSGGALFNNLAGGVFNINSSSPSNSLELNTARFNNAGTLNLSGGTLKIVNNGFDTGRYDVTGDGQLQFLNGNRTFSDGATINSATTLHFVNGKNYFTNGSHYRAPETIVDNATVSFNTGKAITLPSLTIDNGTVSGPDAIKVSTALNFYSGLLTGSGTLTTPNGATTLLTEGQALLNRNWDNFGTVNYGVGGLDIEPTQVTAPQLETLPLPIKQWNNYGVINWQGKTAPATELGRTIVLNNKPGGVFNISNKNPLDVRELNLAAFNNQGTLNLSSGILHISSRGADTGVYNITNTGQLQFWDGARAFNTGADITSANPVGFVNSTVVFNAGATLNAPKTIIDGATVSFNGTATLNDLVMTGGLLNNAKNLKIQGLFDWSGGIVAGKGDFQFANGFNYTAGAMSATGAVDITDTSTLLRLPAMPSITRLTARTTGDLLLTGDLTANGNGNALILATDRRFDNSAEASLSAPNGRWLVYSDSPVTNTLGGLTAHFKHYGCTYNMLCNDAFNVLTTAGNGLLYRITPILTVTPNKLTSVYGNPVNFTATLTGFIDGDDPVNGITGNATYTASGNLSDAGYHNVGKHDVAYSGGLTNTLGYQIKDNRASANEWAITPRALNVIANPASKYKDEPDPLFTYNATGLLTGDKLTGALSRSPGEAVGSYPILQGSLAATTNYRVNYQAAKLKISENSDSDDDDIIRGGIDDGQNTVVALTNQAGLKGGHENEEDHEHHGEPSEKKTKRARPKQCE